MAVDNPFQAPQAYDTYHEVVAPEYERDLKWLLFSFRGRIPRRVFWSVTILAWVAFYGSALVGSLLIPEEILQILLILVALMFFWVLLAIQVKRWHDRAKSGWWILIGFAPLIGPIWAAAETGFCRGTFGPNRYGGDPT